MGDAAQQNCKNEDDLIAQAILDNFSKYAQRPTVTATCDKGCTSRNKTVLDKSTSCFSDWSPRQKSCFTGNALPSRTSVGACNTGSPFMLGSGSNISSSALRYRQPGSGFRGGMNSDGSRFSLSGAKALSSEPGFNGGRKSGFCCTQQRSMTRARGLGGGGMGFNGQCKLDSDDDCRPFKEDNGCDFGGTSAGNGCEDLCGGLETEGRGFVPNRGLNRGGRRGQSACDSSQRTDYCSNMQMGGNGSALDSCLQTGPQQSEVDCYGLNGGESMSPSSDLYRLNTGNSGFPSASFRPARTDPCADDDNCQEEEEDPCFGSGSTRTNGAAYNSFGSPAQASPFASNGFISGSDSFRPRPTSRPTGADFYQLSGDTSGGRFDDCGLSNNDDDALCGSLDSGRPTNGGGGGSQFAPTYGMNSGTNGGSQFISNSLKSNGAYSSFPTTMNESNGAYSSFLTTMNGSNGAYSSFPTTRNGGNGAYSSFPSAMNGSNNLDRSCDPCKTTRASSNYCSDPCETTMNSGSSFRPNSSFNGTGKSQSYTTDLFRSNGGNSYFPDSYPRIDKSSNFTSNSSRPNDDCSDFCSDSLRPADNTLDCPSNAPQRANDECSDFCSDYLRSADKPYPPNSSRPSGECADFGSDSFRPADKSFPSNSFRPSGEGPQFMPDSFRPANKTFDFPSSSFRPDDTCVNFCTEEQGCEFPSNSFRPSGEGPDTFRPPDQGRDIPLNSFRPIDDCSNFYPQQDYSANSFRPNGGEGPNFPADPRGMLCNQNPENLDCRAEADMCDPNDEWDDPSCLANMCGMGLDEWFAVSPSLQKVVAKLASKSLKKGGSALKDLSRLKAANILPPDFPIPGEEQQGASKCGDQGLAEASASQLQLTAEKLVEHIVCRAAKIEAAQDENVDLSECDSYLEEVVKKIGTIIVQATGQQQKENTQGSQPASKCSSKTGSIASSCSSSESNSSANNGNTSANNSAVTRTPAQLHDNICNALMQNCFDLLGVDRSSVEEFEDDFALRILPGCRPGLTWRNINNSQGGFQWTMDGSTNPSASNSASSLSPSNSASAVSHSAQTTSALSNSAMSNSAMSNSAMSNSAVSSSAVPNSAVSISSMTQPAAPKPAAPKPAAPKIAAPKPAAPKPAAPKPAASTSSMSAASVSPMPKPAATNSALTHPSASKSAMTSPATSASVDMVEKRSTKSQESSSSKASGSRRPESHGSEISSAQVSGRQVGRQEAGDGGGGGSHSLSTVGSLNAVSSSRLPPTTFLEFERKTITTKKDRRRESMEDHIFNLLEACLRDCTKLADNAELRAFVMEVVYSLYSTVRTRLEKILREQADVAPPGSLPQPIDEMLINADQEIRNVVLPTVVEHIVWLLRHDATTYDGKVSKNAAKALAGKYVDTIVTNAVLKLEVHGQIRRPYAKTFVVTSNDARYKGHDPMATQWATRSPESIAKILFTSPAKVPASKTTSKASSTRAHASPGTSTKPSALSSGTAHFSPSAYSSHEHMSPVSSTHGSSSALTVGSRPVFIDRRDDQLRTSRFSSHSASRT